MRKEFLSKVLLKVQQLYDVTKHIVRNKDKFELRI